MFTLEGGDLAVGRHQSIDAVQRLVVPPYRPENAVLDELVEILLGRSSH